MRVRLSDRQREIMAIIRGYWGEFGYSPTLRDIVGRMDSEKEISTSVINYNLRQLRERGYITFQDNKTRTIKVLEGKK